jgi:hypothetical protein
MKLFAFLSFVIPLIILQSGCRQSPKADPTAPAQKVSLPATGEKDYWKDYWNQGKAEISSYAVVQERYGEPREAGQVMVFVTEDFSAKNQVKLDAAPEPGDARVPVLKMNAIRRFQTGIYDYSLMQSVFSPVRGEEMRTLKTTTTIQDWCGHIFTQCNAGSDGYRVQSFSYFESEGDVDKQVKPDLLEDEIWTRLRINPNSLAAERVMVLPAIFYSRLRHKPLQPQPASIAIEKGDEESTLNLIYADIPRQLSIRFETAFPHRILAWEETDNGRLLSKGALKNTVMDAYWKHNDNASASLRDVLDPGFYHQN